MARSNGDLVAKARAADRGRRAAARRPSREARALLGVPRARRRGALMQACRSTASASSTSAACCPAASARCCWPTSAPTSSRSRTPAWATTCAGRRPTTRAPRTAAKRAVPRAQPRQALDPARTSRPTSGREVLLRLVARRRRLLESFRPGVLDRLGVGYEAHARGQPGASSTARSPATARTGPTARPLGPRHELPRARRAARPDRRRRTGRRCRPAGQIADLGGGALMAAFGILAALRERDRSGEGQVVDVSMADGALSWLAMVAARYLADGRRAARAASSSSPARSSATGPTRAPTGGSRSARWSRSSGRRGAAASGART